MCRPFSYFLGVLWARSFSKHLTGIHLYLLLTKDDFTAIQYADDLVPGRAIAIDFGKF